MNKKRNVSYIKPEDPEFLKVLKKQAGYDDTNHKFDELKNAEEDFVDDDDNEQPQVVVLKEGDLTAEEAEAEQIRIDKLASETKADLSQRIMFKPKESKLIPTKRKQGDVTSNKKDKKIRPLLSFNDTEEDDDDESNET